VGAGASTLLALLLLLLLLSILVEAVAENNGRDIDSDALIFLFHRRSNSQHSLA
jgi:hypothetical protein